MPLIKFMKQLIRVETRQKFYNWQKIVKNYFDVGIAKKFRSESNSKSIKLLFDVETFFDCEIYFSSKLFRRRNFV